MTMTLIQKMSESVGPINMGSRFNMAKREARRKKTQPVPKRRRKPVPINCLSQSSKISLRLLKRKKMMTTLISSPSSLKVQIAK